MIGANTLIKAGCLIDKNVQIKPNAILEVGSVVSCLTIVTNSKGIISFAPTVQSQENEFFNKGNFCSLPNEMKLD